MPLKIVNERRFTILMGILALLGWVAFGVTLFVFNPENTVYWQYLIVFGGLFLGIGGAIGYISYKVALAWGQKRRLYVSQKEVARRAALLSLCAVGLLALQTFRALNIWNGVALLGTIIVAELFFMSRR